MERVTKWLAKSPKWIWLTVPFILLEILTFALWWYIGKSISLTDILTLILIVVTTVYVALTYGLWVEANKLRIVQFHPALEINFFKSVDPFEFDVPETRDLVEEYLNHVSPEANLPVSDIDLRYENLRITNVGQGQIAELTIGLEISVPNLSPRTIQRKLKPYLGHQQELPLTLFPFRGLPEYQVEITYVEYSDYFGSYGHYYGPTQKVQTLPYRVPQECKKTIFYEDFYDVPFGKGWRLDDWRKTDREQLSDLIRIENRQMRFTGDEDAFRDRHNESGISYIDLHNRVKLGRSYEVQCRVRSDPGTTAKFCLYCHDIHPEGGTSFKERRTEEKTPGTDWEVVKLFYTATQTENLRIHLWYFPGQGTIYVDKVEVFEIQE